MNFMPTTTQIQRWVWKKLMSLAARLEDRLSVFDAKVVSYPCLLQCRYFNVTSAVVYVSIYQMNRVQCFSPLLLIILALPISVEWLNAWLNNALSSFWRTLISLRTYLPINASMDTHHLIKTTICSIKEVFAHVHLREIVSRESDKKSPKQAS